ncbi:hypothetical protein HED52_04040 [Ochrobactrum ciceri]|uniref:Transposase n=1 Tax=Brucella ciceri TaxID=391287 RepID=A0ABX1DW63_9HYPH|nr:hypothetical protein [Brucella ciceri]
MPIAAFQAEYSRKQEMKRLRFHLIVRAETPRQIASPVAPLEPFGRVPPVEGFAAKALYPVFSAVHCSGSFIVHINLNKYE